MYKHETKFGFKVQRYDVLLHTVLIGVHAARRALCRVADGDAVPPTRARPLRRESRVPVDRYPPAETRRASRRGLRRALTQS